jgi:galactokinase
LEVAFASAWSRLGGWSIGLLDLARLCRQAENEYVGVACGLMDQFACAFGIADRGLLFDCRTLDWRKVRIPDGVALVVADTGTRRSLSDGRLNQRREECASAVELLRNRAPGIRALRDVDPEILAEPILPEPQLSRARHVVAECSRVETVAALLDAGDSRKAGALLNESHRSARDLYDVSGPELESMWRIATGQPGCLGGRSVGAGFAGCQVFLVDAPALSSFKRKTAIHYEDETGLRAKIYEVAPARGAIVIRHDGCPDPSRRI